jgi:hypothetical protein
VQKGLGIDDLIKAFIQTALATSAIDKMCCKLINEHTGSLNLSLLATMNPDKALLAEVLQGILTDPSLCCSYLSIFLARNPLVKNATS